MNEKQEKAFECYYKQGLGRSYSKVAKEEKISKATIERWASEFNWQALVKERDKSDAEKLREEGFKAKVLAVKAISVGIEKVLKDLQSGSQTVHIKNFTDWIKPLGSLEVQSEESVAESVESSQQATSDTSETKDVLKQIEDSLAALGGECDA